MERRKSAMKHMNKNLRPLCEGNFSKRGPHLGRILVPKQRKQQITFERLKVLQQGKIIFLGSAAQTKESSPRATGTLEAQTSQSSVFNCLGPSKQAPKFQKANQDKKQQ